MILAFSLFVGILVIPDSAIAETNYYYYPSAGHQQTLWPSYNYNYSVTPMSDVQMRALLQQLILQLQAQLATKKVTYTKPSYHHNYSGKKDNYVVGGPRGYGDKHYDDYYDDEPDVYTNSATNIGRYDAELRGEVDMNDFDDGEVFFVYGTDEELVEDVEYDFDSYSDVETKGDRLEKVRVDSSLDGRETYREDVYDLVRDEDYYFRICVGYEDEDYDATLVCGDVEEFKTDY